MKHYLNCLKKYAKFKGRASRTEFWVFTLINLAIFSLFYYYFYTILYNDIYYSYYGFSTTETVILWVFNIYSILMIIPSLAVFTRRMHDVGKSGWWILLNFIPFGGLFLLVLLCGKSDEGKNEYGKHPDDPTASDTIPQNKTDVNHYFNCLEKYAKFKGRSSRSEYWQFTLISIGIFLLLLLINNVFIDTRGYHSDGHDMLVAGYMCIMILYCGYIITPLLAVTVRRMHDVNKSGWLLFIFLIPFLGQIFALAFLCDKSDEGENKYGKDPNDDIATESEPLKEETDLN